MIARIWAALLMAVALAAAPSITSTDAPTVLGVTPGAGGLAVLDDTSTAAVLTTIGGQPVDTDLTVIAALAPAQGQGIGWDGAAWVSAWLPPMARSVESGFTIPTSGTTMTSRNHAVTYVGLGTTDSIVFIDCEPALQITSASGVIGYTPSAWASMQVPSSGAIVMEQVVATQQALTNYDLVRHGWTSATIAAVAETTAAPARATLLVKPDGSVYLETSDGTTRTATVLSGLTWVTGTAYQVLISLSSTSATARVRAAGSTTVYSATTASTLPAAATSVGSQLYLDRASGSTGGAWSALRMWRARPAL